MLAEINQKYFPSFSTMQGELRAYTELPEDILDRILPIVTLTREREAPSLDSSLNDVLQVANGRRVIIDFDKEPREVRTPDEIKADREKKAKQRELDKKKPFNPSAKQEAHWASQRNTTIQFNESITALQVSAGGYQNWRNFSMSAPNVIPIIQTADPGQIVPQVQAIANQKRRMAFRIDVNNQNSLASFLVAAPYLDQADRTIIILDAGYVRGRVTAAKDLITNALDAIRTNTPKLFDGAVKVCAAGSFPKTVTDLVSPLDIEERNLFDRVVADGWDVRYGDHASVQPRSSQKGGNGWLPHVEVAHQRQWHFASSDKNSVSKEYEKCAKALVNNPTAWSGRCASWGTDMVERASQGHLDDGLKPPLKLTTPGPWVGVRVSQHIVQQARHP